MKTGQLVGGILVIVLAVAFAVSMWALLAFVVATVVKATGVLG